MSCRNLAAIAVLILVGCMSASQSGAAGESDGTKQDEQAIRAAAKQYLAALARGDAKALTALWTTDGDFVDVLGRSHPARELIAEEAKTAAADERPEIKLAASSIRFLTPDVALEDGTSEVMDPSAKELPPLRGRFTAVWVKQGGQWLLSSLREARAEPPPVVEKLSDLDWMAGKWSAEHDGITVEVSARWNPTRTFLLRDLNILRKDERVFSGTQRIGWDPLARKIKSWTFDSNGGYGEGAWTKRGEAWIVEASGVLPDGRKTSSTNVYTFDDKDSFTWTSMGSRTNGKAAADFEIKLVRRPEAK